MRILLVEDDTLIGRGLVRAFDGSGAAIDWARNGTDALLALRSNSYAAVLLDLGLPQKSGLAVLKEMRSGSNKTPVLIITARDESRPGLQLWTSVPTISLSSRSI